MLGRPVVARLLADGYQVRVMSRSLERVLNIFGESVEAVVGDVTDKETLKEIMPGCDGVYISLNAKMNLADYDRIEHRGAANVAAVAAELGLERIAMISGLTVGDGDTRFEFIDAKAKAEQALKECGVPFTILRCCWFYESLPLFVTGKQATVFGKQPIGRYWMAASDYAPMVGKVFELKEAENRIFHIRGIDRHTMPEALSKFCEICYPDARLVKVPLWTVSLVSKFSRKGAMKGIVRFMKYFEKHPEPEIDDDSDRILGPALTTLKDWAEDYKAKIMVK